MSATETNTAHPVPTTTSASSTRKAPARAYRPGCGGVVERDRAVEVFGRACEAMGWSVEIPR